MKISGKKLKLALRGAGITQEQAAERLKVTRQTIGNWVNRAELDQDILHKVKYALEIDLQNDNIEPKPNSQPEPYTETDMLTKEVVENLNDLLRVKNERIKDLERQVAELSGVKAKRSAS